MRTLEAYLDAVADAATNRPGTIARWLSDRCDECGRRIDEAAGLFVLEHHELVDTPEGPAVVVGCEGYWQVSPAAVGIDCPAWSDWTDELDR